MRVAVLCDIHGNLPALEAVLAEVEREGPDGVVCGGDVVGGPFSAEVFDRLAVLPDVRYVRGNADRLVLDGVAEHDVDWSVERDRLGPERLAKMANWPLTLGIEVAGVGRVLVCHAVPEADEPIFTRVTPDDEVTELFAGVDAEVAVCGHTHVQFDRRLPNGLRIVNAGSVGMPYQGRRGAFWALLGPDVELRHTEYDVEAAAAAIRGIGGANNERQAGWLLEPPDADEATAFFESRRHDAGGA
jgi:putative phosphoesterase